jgi:hypothetical protein
MTNQSDPIFKTFVKKNNMFQDYSYKKDSSERSPNLSGILPLKLQPAKILKQ